MIQVRTSFLLWILLCSAIASAAPAARLSDLQYDNFLKGSLLEGSWKYHSGDDAGFAAPDLDDSGWENVPGTWQLPRSWNGAGWFRFHLRIDPGLVQKSLALILKLGGPTDIYIQGRQAFSFSEKEFTAMNPEPLSLPSTEIVLAVRYVNRNPERLPRLGFYPGFASWIGDWRPAAETNQLSLQQETLLIGMMLAFSILHAVLFLFHREERLNLYFAVLAASIAIMVFTERQDMLIHREAMVWMRRLWGTGMILTCLAALRFTYFLRDPAMPRQFPVLAVIGAAILVWGWNRLAGGWIRPAGAENYISLYTLILLAEMGRSFVLTSIHRPSEGVRILGLGSIPIIVTGIYQMLINFGIAKPLLPFFQLVPLTYYAMLFLLAAMSVHLSRSFARTNRELRTQLSFVKELSDQKLEQERQSQQREMQRQLLEADNRRKTEELEEARRLQLSMLPKNVPLIPGLEACFYMKTATEVGGDYYDFYRNGEATITIAIGDATGHGMQAGTMVAAAKSLFQNLADEPSLITILQGMSATLKRMNFGRMYMALALARFHANRIQLACAGMPPPLIYRVTTHEVEELRLKGIWLGGTAFPYEQIETELAPGDTLLLMSDGYPEMFNPAGEMLGYSVAKSCFAEAANETPGDLIAALVRRGERWAAGRTQDDDVTFAMVRAAIDSTRCYPCSIEVSTAR